MNEVDFISDILFGDKDAISQGLKSYAINEMLPVIALTEAGEASLKLKALTNLLVAKGVITQEEIDAADARAEQTEFGLFIKDLNQKLMSVVALLEKHDEK